MELCIHIDTNTGFQFDGYVVIPDSDLLDPASYQRFVKFGEVGSLLRNIILQVIDVFLRVQAEIARRANITPDRMLMCHKVTHKNLIDSSPLFRYCLTHASCNFFVKTIDSDTSKEI